MTSPINLDNWITENLFNSVSMSCAVVDTEFNIIYANNAFEQMFGKWKTRKCYSVYKNRDSICTSCKAANAFKDGIPRTNEEVGYDKSGQRTNYLKHTIPVPDEEGNIGFLIEISTDITETIKIRKERQLLFDQVPCNILVIDKDFNITSTNKKIREMFGDIEGKTCYQSLKGLDSICRECIAWQTFEDGKTHTGYSTVKDKSGKTVHFQVTTVPLESKKGKVKQVMEMAVDITETLKLEKELKIAHTFMESMIATSVDGIIGMDSDGEIVIFNKAARKMINVIGSRQVQRNELDYILPKGFLDQISSGPGHVYLPETDIETIDGNKVPARLTGFQIIVDDSPMGMSVFIQDLREMRQLENEKLEAERLAAVGQTVAGLAHGVKNLITSLEGGMYMLKSGMKNSKIERIQEGMEMLGRNIERISTFVKEFLSFSKGRAIVTGLCDPADIAKEVVGLYQTKAKGQGIDLQYMKIGDIAKAPMDYEGIHESLTNLVGNAIDACIMSDNKKSNIWVRVSEDKGVIIYEVEDNGCGMDYDVKKKVFTNFFTTKGLGGTGLGLLTTKKIVQEHGGKTDMVSEKDKGTTFIMRLPRNRLPKPAEK